MNLPASPAVKAMNGPSLYEPAISIVLPFEPKMVPKSKISDALKAALDTVHRHFATTTPSDSNILVMQKLRKAVRNLNFDTYTKSVAIYISPVFEKVLYLDILVEPKVTVNEPLDIRNLVLAKKSIPEFLVLHIDEFSSNIYHGVGEKLSRIKSNILYSDEAEQSWEPKNIWNSVEQRLKNISRCSDKGLTDILQAYPLPVFVIGPRRAVNYFTQNTSAKEKVIECLYIREDPSSQKEIARAIQPILNDWKKVQQKYLRHLLETANTSHKLATGIGNVWKMASKWAAALLMVEKNYRPTDQLLESEEGLYTSSEPYTRYSHIRNAVDYIIEIVLENGGDVEFVETEILNGCKNIALVQR